MKWRIRLEKQSQIIHTRIAWCTLDALTVHTILIRINRIKVPISKHSANWMDERMRKKEREGEKEEERKSERERDTKKNIQKVN